MLILRSFCNHRRSIPASASVRSPKKMALELFKPFIYGKLELRVLLPPLKLRRKWLSAKKLSLGYPGRSYPRTPGTAEPCTDLHRLGIQAFEPVLIEGKAIHCTRWFVRHITPTSMVTRWQSRTADAGSPAGSACADDVYQNILSPANGEPIIVPSQDVVLVCTT